MCCRIVGIIFVLGGGVAIGIKLAYRHKKRVSELLQLEHSLIYIAGELKYRHLVLADIFGQAATRSAKAFSKWLLTLQEVFGTSNELSAQKIWGKALEELELNTSLSNSDIAILESVGYLLGSVDLDTQIREFQIITEQLHDVRVQAEHNLANKIKVTVSLCSVAAILLVIIFV